MRNIIRLVTLTFITLKTEYSQDYNPYKILGVSNEATSMEIKKAYKKLSIKYHPDKIKSKSNSEEMALKFKEITEAYEILSDKKNKYIYDIQGVEGLQKLSPQGGQQEDDIFSSFFGGGFGGGGGLRKGQSLQLQYQVSLEDIYLGKEHTIQFNKKVVCPKCRGTGAKDGQSKTCDKCKGKGITITQQNMGYSVIQYQTQCDKCGGKGKIIKNKCTHCSGRKLISKNTPLDFVVEKGIPNNHQITFEMESHHVLDGFPGDVFVVLTEKKHDRFIREGNNLIYKKKISLKEALLGVTFYIDHLDGNQFVVTENKIIYPGFRTVVQGKGMPKHETPSEYGNMVIQYTIDFPKSLTAEQRKALDKLL